MPVAGSGTQLSVTWTAAGGAARHVVKVVVYLTDVGDRQKINPIRQTYFGEHRPASTLVEVSALVMPELKVEIEAEAFVGHKRALLAHVLAQARPAPDHPGGNR